MQESAYPDRTAFSLVELLVVIAIIAVLSALVLGMAGSGERLAKESQSRQVMEVVAAGIERFRRETGFLPIPAGSATDPMAGGDVGAGTPREPLGGTDFTAWYPTTSDPGAAWDGQRLAWRLLTPMDGAANQLARDRAQRAWETADPSEGVLEWERYRNALTGSDSWQYNAAEWAAVDPVAWASALRQRISDAEADAYCITERFDVDKNPWIHVDKDTGTPIPPVDFIKKGGEAQLTYRGRVKIDYCRLWGERSQREVVRLHSTAQAIGRGDLPSGALDGEGRILDAWGEPLAYVSSAAPDLVGGVFRLSDHTEVNHPAQVPGRSRLSLVDRNGDGEVGLDDLAVAPASLPPDLNGDGSVDRLDWGSLCWYALPGNERGFVLWSAGSDRLQHLVQSEAVNEDNLLQWGGVD